MHRKEKNMKLVKIKKEIFREYDIRGIYEEDLNSDVAYTIGRSFATIIKDKHVIIGRDNRLSSPVLHDALVQGLLESGASIIDLGLVTTPMYYFAKKKNNIENGIMITASHNPKEYNGFKISFSHEGNAYGKTIYDFRDFTDKLEFDSKKGSITNLDIEKDYLDLIKNSVDLKGKKIKAVFDCGNGTGSIIIKKILKMFPNIETEFLFCESDPTFPNHHPDPSVKKNQEQLSLMVKKLGYDIGIGIDGDADRVGIVDNNGTILGADIYMILMYRYLYPFLKEKKAIYDVKCSRVLIDDLKRLGYQTTMYRTGNSYMNQKINQDNYEFGGEYSGHVWFKDKFPGFDDGIYAGLRAIEVLSNSKKSMTELLTNLNTYYSSNEEKIKVTEETKFLIVDKIKQYCLEKNYQFEDIDGVRVEFKDAWALVRASNTGPDLTVRFEATTENRAEELKKEFLKEIKKAQDELFNN